MEAMNEDNHKGVPKDPWVIVHSYYIAGWPTPFKFKTRKEASAKANKIRAQARYDDVVVMRLSEYNKP